MTVLQSATGSVAKGLTTNQRQWNSSRRCQLRFGRNIERVLGQIGDQIPTIVRRRQFGDQTLRPVKRKSQRQTSRHSAPCYFPGRQDQQDCGETGWHGDEKAHHESAPGINSRKIKRQRKNGRQIIGRCNLFDWRLSLITFSVFLEGLDCLF